MSRTVTRLAVAGGLTALLGGVLAAAPSQADSHGSSHAPAKHVLLVSVDGLHQSDLAWYVKQHPNSALAALVKGGVDYSAASTPVPSDSFPGMTAQVTGGDPGTTGVYYDDTYNHGLLPAGTTACDGSVPLGAEVDLTEDLDWNKASIDAGQGLTGLPNSILNLTGDAKSLINPAKLPVDPKTCKPVAPNSYLQVNTVFNVIADAGLRTAWSDKHAAYDILSGPSGDGIQDLFTPEINSQDPALPAGQDWTTDNAATRQYDDYKVQAVLNEIDGYDHSGKTKVGTPAILGLNFQSVSTAQKLPTSDGQGGGYLADGKTPGPLLSGSLDFVNGEVGRFTAELKKDGLAKSTTIILSAKHGQSPKDPAALTRIPDGPLLDGLNAAWKKAHPGAGDLVAFSVDDDAMLLWLNDRSQAAADFAKNYLLAQSGSGNGITGAAKPFTHGGLTTVYAGAEARRYFHAQPGDTRVPDLFGVAQQGVVYTGGKSKIAEHGGASADDRNVPIVVSGAGVSARGVNGQQVETTQIAPTILRLLGLDPQRLQAVRIEHTAVLPELGRDRD
ncbi:type I phosphodiesterase/nucleotide pyrophosphatase [Catenulispora acidiphila DSM 44928]|uniref:Type I phosphodiesterase/nucleotide pyrophosphatase n=1 Tax=Catenulispora acidiphila (strain DSM 44928 / JCM 14897 / NBRC 102108 / NRRL B-24433 / ID139908) TaxID=479433 RepID=C7QH30_CATAD|nr:alkaline phosphatase family protein [Catenulispora acidiphila]ACU76880.1 type I phosphodiesterase/nucleotide pyrophosphatase [Catenulispora acidiphila DSM 44928]